MAKSSKPSVTRVSPRGEVRRISLLETVWKLRFCSNWGFTRPRNEDERSQFGTLQLAKDVLSDTSSDFPDSLSRDCLKKMSAAGYAARHGAKISYRSVRRRMESA